MTTLTHSSLHASVAARPGYSSPARAPSEPPGWHRSAADGQADQLAGGNRRRGGGAGSSGSSIGYSTEKGGQTLARSPPLGNPITDRENKKNQLRHFPVTIRTPT